MANPLTQERDWSNLCNTCLSRTKSPAFRDALLDADKPLKYDITTADLVPGCLLCSMVMRELKSSDNDGSATNQVTIQHFRPSIILLGVNRPLGFNYTVFARPSDPAAGDIATIHEDVDSPWAWKLARNWISTCLQGHETCPLSTNHFFPKRVIDLSTEPPRLLVDHPPEAGDPYVTLSYCWGGPQSQELLQNRLTTYTTRLPIQTLPQTILDAFHATKTLGFRFIWIDSLCIIQDSPSDKLQQIALMAQIYTSSTLCIVAATSPTVKTGFLGPRPDFLLSNPRVPFLCSNATTLGTIALSSTRPQLYYHAEENPIEARAWTYQERLLSPRVLIYSHNGLRFVCRNGADSNVQGNSWFAQNRDPEYIDIAASDARVWRDLVVVYTRRALSVPSDKLVAISALARMHAEGRGPGDAYLAGLWRSSIAGDLLWEALFESGMEDAVRRHCAPSWSWAATDARVAWPSVAAEASTRISDFELAEARVVPKEGHTAYGQMERCLLRVKGRTLRLDAEWMRNRGWGLSDKKGDGREDVTTWRPTPLRLFEPPNPARRVGGQTWVDDPMYTSSFRMSFDRKATGCSDCVLLLVVVSTEGESEPHPRKRLCGLVLEEVGGNANEESNGSEESMCRRVGLFEFDLHRKLRAGPMSDGVAKPSSASGDFSCLWSLENSDIESLILV